MPGQPHARAAGHLAPARSERSGEPAGLTGEHAWHPGPHPTDGPFAAFAAGAWEGGGSDESPSKCAAPERDGEQNQGKDMRGASGVVGISFSRLLNKAPPRDWGRPDDSPVWGVVVPAPGGRKRQRPSPAWAKTARGLGSPAGRIGRGRRRRQTKAASGSAWRVGRDPPNPEAHRRAAPPDPRRAAGNGRPARSPGPANGRLHGVKGERPAEAGRLAALDEKYGLIANREVTSTTSE